MSKERSEHEWPLLGNRWEANSRCTEYWGVPTKLPTLTKSNNQ